MAANTGKCLHKLGYSAVYSCDKNVSGRKLVQVKRWPNKHILPFTVGICRAPSRSGLGQQLRLNVWKFYEKYLRKIYTKVQNFES